MEVRRSRRRATMENKSSATLPTFDGLLFGAGFLVTIVAMTTASDLVRWSLTIHPKTGIFFLWATMTALALMMTIEANERTFFKLSKTCQMYMLLFLCVPGYFFVGVLGARVIGMFLGLGSPVELSTSKL